MTDIKLLAHKIAVLQGYSAQSGVKTVRSQVQLLRDLSVDETVRVLELVAAELRSEKAGQ